MSVSYDINIFDVSTAKRHGNIPTLSITIEADLITVEEIIRKRVEAEVESFNNNQEEGRRFNSLVQPKEAERTLNGFKTKNNKKIDPIRQTSLAINAFRENSYFIIINNQQVETLEEEVVLSDNMTVEFFKLVALVGG